MFEERQKPAPLTIDFCQKYVRGLQEYLLEPDMFHTIRDIKLIKEEIEIWSGVIRVMRTIRFYRGAEYSPYIEEIIKSSSINKEKNELL